MGDQMPVAIRVKPWPDPVLDVLGHDPRSWYAGDVLAADPRAHRAPVAAPPRRPLRADAGRHRPPDLRHGGGTRARPAGGSELPADEEPHPPPHLRARVHRRRGHDDLGAAFPPTGASAPRAAAARAAAGAARGMGRRPDQLARAARPPPGTPCRPHARRAGRVHRHRRARARTAAASTPRSRTKLCAGRVNRNASSTTTPSCRSPRPHRRRAPSRTRRHYRHPSPVGRGDARGRACNHSRAPCPAAHGRGGARYLIARKQRRWPLSYSSWRTSP